MQYISRICSLIAFTLAFLVIGVAQTQPSPTSTPAEIGPVRSSPAYAEVLLRKTEIESDLISFAEDYTDSNPKVVDAKFELACLTKDLDRLFGVKPSEVSRLTEAVGRLITRKAELETELNRLLRTYNNEHPAVKRARRKVELFANAVKQILG